jgi:mono/diheme cytochrome c family protein
MRTACIAGLALGLAVGCGSARRSEPIAGPVALSTASARHGERVFMRHCHSCHPGGDAGLGPSLNDKPLPRFLMAFQIRQGLGAMPAFPADTLDDASVAQLLDYLVALRRHGG